MSTDNNENGGSSAIEKGFYLGRVKFVNIYSVSDNRNYWKFYIDGPSYLIDRLFIIVKENGFYSIHMLKNKINVIPNEFCKDKI